MELQKSIIRAPKLAEGRRKGKLTRQEVNMQWRRLAPVFVDIVKVLLGVLDLRHGDDEVFSPAAGMESCS